MMVAEWAEQRAAELAQMSAEEWAGVLVAVWAVTWAATWAGTWAGVLVAASGLRLALLLVVQSAAELV